MIIQSMRFIIINMIQRVMCPLGLTYQPYVHVYAWFLSTWIHPNNELRCHFWNTNLTTTTLTKRQALITATKITKQPQQQYEQNQYLLMQILRAFLCYESKLSMTITRLINRNLSLLALYEGFCEVVRIEQSACQWLYRSSFNGQLT